VAHRPSCNGSEATDSSLLGGSLTASAAGVADMLLGPGGVAAANAAAAAANAAAVAACSAEGMQWAKGGWAVEFDITGFGSGVPEGDDEAMATARGITANFRTVHRAAEALGCVPEMLSSKDFAEHGPDERTVILYAAFLCSRLLECSRDDRAAHIIQCAWRQRKASTAGMARAHLAKWVAAASLVQRAARAWLLRRRVHEFVLQHRSAAEALQAAWRGWQVRQGLQRQRTACVNVQVRLPAASDSARQCVFHACIAAALAWPNTVRSSYVSCFTCCLAAAAQVARAGRSPCCCRDAHPGRLAGPCGAPPERLDAAPAAALPACLRVAGRQQVGWLRELV
jgi:hypothetical protein